MNVFLWIVAGILAAVFLGAGVFKVSQPKEKLIASGLEWVEDLPLNLVRTLGALEILAAVGLILPPALDIAPVLAPLAALGLIVIMIGAIVTHARRKETPMVALNVVLLVLSAIIVWGRFGPYSF